MAFGSLILTNKGREVLTKAQLGDTLKFTGIAIGDGSYNGSYNDITALSNQVAVLDILRAETKGSSCMLEADISNEGVTAGYYLREIGILAQSGDETVLYAYTNAGEDAEYIPAGNDAVSMEKRLRLSLLTEGVSDITFDAASVMYVAQNDFDETVQDIRDILGKKQDCFAAMIDLSGSEYDQYTWYPVTGTPIPKGGLHKIRAYTTFDLGAHPSWATNSSGYTCNMEMYDKSQEWGQTDGSTLCTNYSWKHTNQIPCGYLQMANSSIPVLTLRGGGIYYVETDYESDWTVRTGAYTYRDNTVRPENAARFEFNRTTIFANLDGNVNEAYVNFQENSSYEIASGDKVYTLFGKLKKFVNTVKSKAPYFLTAGRVPYADKIYTKRYIDGVGFDGSANASHYGICSTSGNAHEKTVDIPGFKLMVGARIIVLFLNEDTSGGALLNVSNTMAAYILYKGKPMPSNYIKSNSVLELVFDGRDWHVVGDLTQMQVDQLKEQANQLKEQANELTAMIMAGWEKLTNVQIFGSEYTENYHNGHYVKNTNGNFLFVQCPDDCQNAVIDVSSGETYAIRTYYNPNHTNSGFAVCGGEYHSYGFSPNDPMPESKPGRHLYVVRIPDYGCNRLVINNHLCAEGNIEVYKKIN